MPTELARAPKLATGRELEVSRMTIEVADNGGFTVNVTKRQPEGAAPGAAGTLEFSEPSRQSVFSDTGALLKFIEKELGVTESAADNDADD